MILQPAMAHPAPVLWPDAQRDWFLAVNRFAQDTPWLHDPMRLYAEYGVGLFAAALLVAWWSARRDPDPRAMAAALWAPLGSLLALGLNQPLVSYFHEARPYSVFPDALALVAHSQDYSFPSDHAVMAGAVTAGVALAHRRLGLATAVAAVGMAFARVYVGAHFPFDVIVGLLFGVAVTLLGYLAVRRPLVSAVTGLTRTPIRPLLTSGRGSTAR
jgi:undecaprenyl-diphosphatase